MKKAFIIALMTQCLIIVSYVQCFPSWLVYHKPAFNGKVIDEESKEPIKGAVVVVMYYSSPIISGPGGGSSSIIHVKEALTDVSGEFHIPAYTTLIQPNSYSDFTDFIIYKPGYASYTALYHNRIYPLKYRGPEVLFSKELGTKDELRRGSEVITITNGVVELPKLEGKEERLRAMPAPPSGFYAERLPLLYKAINEEQKRFGLKPWR